MFLYFKMRISRTKVAKNILKKPSLKIQEHRTPKIPIEHSETP